VWVTLQANAPARVSVDDDALGTTPLAPVSIRPGTHKFVFHHTLLGDHTVVTTVRPDEPLTISVDFTAKNKQNCVRVTPMGR
jgi:hypothetical protein